MSADVYDLTYTDVQGRVGISFSTDSTPTAAQVTTEITRVAAAVSNAVAATGRSPGTYISTATGQDKRTYYVLQDAVLLGITAYVVKAASPAEVDKHKEAADAYEKRLQMIRDDDPLVYGVRRVGVRGHVTDNIDDLDEVADYASPITHTDREW